MHSIRRSRTRRAAAAAALVTLLLPWSAFAHNGAVHRDMTDLSWQVMRQVVYELNGGTLPRGGSIIANPGVDDAKWKQFLQDIKAAHDRLAMAPYNRVEAIDPATTTGLTTANYQPGGVYNLLHGYGVDTSGSYFKGRLLGEAARSIDYNLDETHLWARPTSMGLFGALKTAYQKAWKLLAGAVFGPFVCLWDLFSGGDCSTDTKKLASETDVAAKVEGLVPGIGDITSEDLVTVWHFINVQNSVVQSNDYDDHQGLLYLEAGWMGPTPSVAPAMDPLDFGLLVVTTATGLSIKYDPSLGPKNYESPDGSDFHQPTVHRTKGQWQSLPMGVTAMEPLDNLALFGWDTFKGDHNLAWFGRPLHALEDACAPHHAIGVTGWGHRPYEEVEEIKWQALRSLSQQKTGGADELARTPTASEVYMGGQQGRRILLRAFLDRQNILAWRANHAGSVPPGDVPVRDLVTKVAQDTLSYATSHMSTEWWPYKMNVSLEYAAGDKLDISGGKGLGENEYNDEFAKAQPLIERGCGAVVAFLTSASEVLP